MAVTINFTGRRKLDRDEFRIQLDTDSDGVPTFNLDLTVKEKDFKPESRIYVEANTGNTLQRFDFGKLEKINKPESTRLDQLAANSTPKFRVLVVDDSEKHGRLLAAANRIRAHSGDEESGSSLLVIKTWDLGEQLWNVDMHTNERPELTLNNRIPDFMQMLKTDRFTQALMLPAAFRQVMTNYQQQSNRSEDDVIQELWWELAETCGGELRDADDIESFSNWLDAAVNDFCNRHHFCSNLLQDMAAEKQ